MNHKTKIIAVWLIPICFCLSACKNDISVVHSLTIKDKSPVEVIENVHMFLSREGVIEQEFLIAVLHRYVTPERYFDCPKGLEIITYNLDKTKRVSLTADYGVNYEDRKRMEAKRNVVITNFVTGEIIETEHLVWDLNKKLIYSDTQIKQTKSDGSVYIGERFESNEDMSKYTVFKTRIISYVDEE